MTKKKTVRARVVELTDRDLSEVSGAAAYQHNQTDLDFLRSKTEIVAGYIGETEKNSH